MFTYRKMHEKLEPARTLVKRLGETPERGRNALAKRQNLGETPWRNARTWAKRLGEMPEP